MRCWVALFYAVAILAVGTAGARQQDASASLPERKLTTFQLDNGLTVILAPDGRVPIVAVNVWYHVGPANESAGRTGFAHLFEHLMFEGSRHVPEGAIDTLLEAAGANNNGTTSFDRTNYFESFSRDYLPLALWIEADRMGYLLDKFDPRTLASQQAIVRNERRQNIENRPYGLADEQAVQLLYPRDHPYHGVVIGSHKDIQAAEYDDVRQFFTRYYRPTNATIAIAGDIDVVQTRALVDRYFGSLRSGEPVPKPTAIAPQITRERRAVVTDTIEFPRVYMSWLAPGAYQPGDAEAALAIRILADGKASRLYKRLVYERQIAQSVEFQHEQTLLGSPMVLSVTARANHSATELESAIDAELERFQREGPSGAELLRARRAVELQLITATESLTGLTERLNHYQYYVRTPDYASRDLARFAAVSAEEVRRFAERAVRKDARVVVYAVPGKKELGTEIPTPGMPSSSSTFTASLNQAEPWRAEAPAPLEEPRWQPPVPARFVLPNGLTVLLLERHDLPLVAADLLIQMSAAQNGSAQAGISSLTADMLDEGTRSASAMEIADSLASLGASLHIRSWEDGTALRARSLRPVFKQTLNIVADIAQHPTFPDDEFERQRALRLAALEQENDNPDSLADRAMLAELFGEKHPYGTPPQGSVESIRALTRSMIHDHWRRFVSPQQSALLVAGDISQPELRAIVQELFGGWTAAPDTSQLAVPVVKPPTPRLITVERPGAPQTVLRVARVGPPRGTPDFATLRTRKSVV